MIIKTLVQLDFDSEPQEHYALVFDDVICPRDFITYRNALTTVCREMASSPEMENISGIGNCIYWLLQMAEYISESLDTELKNAEKTANKHETPLDGYMRHIAETNDIILRKVLDNLNQNKQ